MILSVHIQNVKFTWQMLLNKALNKTLLHHKINVFLVVT